jgi:DNA-binding NarL/FixJ family response regulator
MEIAAWLQAERADRLVTSLSTLVLQLHALRATAEESAAPEVRQALESLEQGLQTLLAEVRAWMADGDLPPLESTAAGRLPPAVPGPTLAEALSRLVEETAESLALASRIQVGGEERPLEAAGEYLLYRLAREALYAAAHHRDIHRLRLTLYYGREALEMRIEDDGEPPESTSAEEPAPPFAPAPSRATALLEALGERLTTLGGRFEMVHAAGQGTRVTARLPYSLAASASPSGPAPAAPGGLPLQPLRLLIVEGQTLTRAGLRRLLESYPDLQIIGEAADGVQATGEALELGPQVVLLDMQLPDGQSLETLRQIKQLSPDTRILAFSASHREEQLYEALRAGVDGYLLKEVAPDELVQAIRAVARGETVVQPRLAGQLLARFGKEGRAAPRETLTAREQQVLRLLARGLRNKEIARQLQVSERTVNFHLANIYQKLNVSGRTEALSRALEQGLL